MRNGKSLTTQPHSKITARMKLPAAILAQLDALLREPTQTYAVLNAKREHIGEASVSDVNLKNDPPCATFTIDLFPGVECPDIRKTGGFSMSTVPH